VPRSRASATLSRRLRLLLWFSVPLPALLLLITSTRQYESELRVETERRLALRAKDSGLEVYGRLVDLTADLRVAARQPNLVSRLENHLEPWRDRYRRLLVLGEGGLPEGAHPPSSEEAKRWEKRFRIAGPVLVEVPAGDGTSSLWLGFPLDDPPRGRLWAELRVEWLWRPAARPAEGGISWLLLGAGGGSLLATSADPDPGFVERLRARARDGVGTLDWTDSRGLLWRAVFVTIPLGFEFGHPGLVAVVAEADRLGPKAALLRRTSWLVALGGLLIAALVSVRRLRGDLEPLSELERQANRMASGDLSARARIAGPADVERLAAGFNRMGELIERNFHLLEAGNAVALAALNAQPTVEQVASSFVDNVRPIAPALGEPVVVLCDRDQRLSLVRARAGGGARAEPWAEPLPPFLAPILESTGWIRSDQTIVEAAAGRGRGVSAWRAIRRDGRAFGVVGLLAEEGSHPDDAFLLALEGPCRQLDLAISRVQLLEEHARAEAAMRTAERRLKTLIASSPAVLYTLEFADGGVRDIGWMSENVRALLGYAPEETGGLDWWIDRFHPSDREGALAEFRAQIASQDRAFNEFRVLHRDGEYRWLRSEGRLVRDARGEPVEIVGAISEITERKNLEAQVRHAQRMESLGRLAAGVAHDFNNLLTIISGRSDLLLSALAPDDPMRDEVLQIHLAGERGSGLTRQLLAFSRQSVLELRILDLNEVVRENEKLLRRVIGEDVRLSLALAPGLWRVKADAGQIGQVLINVVINARDAMPTGGDLTLRSENVQVDAAQAATRSAVRAGRFVALTVSDTGSGMTPEVQSRIFEPFFTTKGPGIGTGLGLATAYGIVQQTGGFIDVASELGRGTSFTFYFPATDEVAAPRRAPLGLRAAPQQGTGTILLVEDEDAVRSMLRRVLVEAGYAVLEASNGTEALRLAAEQAGPIDLVITDVVMPGMGGGTMVEWLAGVRPDLKVLYISGYMDDAVVRQGVTRAEVAFLQKPFTMAALTARVRELLDPGDTEHPPAG